MTPLLTPCLAARRTFEEAEGRPLFLASWTRVVFIHYEVDPRFLQPLVPFRLDVWKSRAYVSLVAFTLADLRFAVGGPPFSTHGFLNLRTYLPGNAIYFLAEWLPNPACVFLGPRFYGLPYRRGRLEYAHEPQAGRIHGRVSSAQGTLEYQASMGPDATPGPCETGSLDEFLLERYTALTWRRSIERLFRVWHEPWPAVPVEAALRDESLVSSTGPWFRYARVVRAHYSPGLTHVWMGRPRRKDLEC